MKRGFTLPELLVVIAILAVLAALLFPAFIQAKGSAKEVSCIGNLNQIGAAMVVYMGDYDGLFPSAVDASDKFEPQIWEAYPDYESLISTMPLVHQVLMPYTLSPEVFHCPSDTGNQILDSHPDTAFPTAPSMYAMYGSSYFYRTEVAFQAMSESDLHRPAAVNLMFDAAGHWHGGARPLQPGDLDNATDYLSVISTYRYNVLFADFHVKDLNHDALMADWTAPL